MNFRYHAIVIAFLAVAIHFHHNESIGTISMAQQAPAAEPQGSTVLTPGKPLRVDGDGFAIIVEKKLSTLSNIDKLMEKESSTRTAFSIEIEGDVPVELPDCKCEIQGSTLKEVLKSAEEHGVLAKAKKLAEDEKEKKKKAEAEARTKVENCTTDKFEDDLRCLANKTNEANTSAKSELKDKLFNLLQGQLNTHGEEESGIAQIKTLTVIDQKTKRSKTVFDLLDSSQVTTLTNLIGEYVGAKHSMKINEELNARVQPKYIQAIESENGMEKAALFQQGIMELNKIRTTSGARSANAFDAEMGSILGSRKTSQNINAMWKNANRDNDALYELYKDPSTEENQQAIASAVFRTNMYDTSGVYNSKLGLASLFRQTNSLEQGQLTPQRIAELKNRQIARNLGLSFGLTSDNQRPTFDGLNRFQHYLDSLKRNEALMGNRGLSTNLLDSYRDPLATTPTPTALGGRNSNGRPT